MNVGRPEDKIKVGRPIKRQMEEVKGDLWMKGYARDRREQI